MKKYVSYGGIAGFINGLIGGGGGAVLVPLLKKEGLSQQEALATSVGVMLPISCFSVVLYATRGDIQWIMALPYVIGGGLGGILGGKCFPKVKQQWLRRGFGAFLLLSGGRCLLW